MRQWITLLQKELLEMWRNFKWIWVPITFILLGVNEPLSTYYMPQIIDSLGGMPKGAVIKIPTPSAVEVFIQSLSQYTTIGVLIISLITMGVVAGERRSGVAAMILVKPISYRSYITAKWAGGILLTWFSFLIGVLSTWYYTGILFDWISFGDSIQAFLLYGIWLTVVLTISLFFSALVLTPGVSGFLSIAVVMIISIVTSSLSHWLKWSPAQLTNYSNEILLSGNISKYTYISSVVALACIIVLLTTSVFIFRKKELAA